MIYNGVDFDTYLKSFPDQAGYFGKYGGCYISDDLRQAMAEITEAYFTICKSSKFISELRRIRREFQGRPTPISHLERLSGKLGNVQLYAKREDLNHTGAHKLNHCMGEALLASYMGKKKVIAETGAGQHGVALATAAAYTGDHSIGQFTGHADKLLSCLNAHNALEVPNHHGEGVGAKH